MIFDVDMVYMSVSKCIVRFLVLSLSLCLSLSHPLSLSHAHMYIRNYIYT